jgi:DNA modification methylase
MTVYPDGPSAGPAGPVIPADTVRVVNDCERLSEVGATAIKTTNRHPSASRAVPEIIIEPAADYSRQETISALEATDRLGAGAEAIEVQPVAPDETVCAPPLGVTEAAVARVVVWRHPVATTVQQALETIKDVALTALTWTPSPTQLEILPEQIAWDRVSPLAVHVEATGSVNEGLVETIKQKIRTAITATWTGYVPEITGVKQAAALGETSEKALFKVGFTNRERQSRSESRIVGADGAMFSGILAEGPYQQDIQLTVTSPPYVDAIDYDEHATSGDGDWSEFKMDDTDVAAWQSHQRDLFESVHAATREGGFCAVVIGHVKRDTGEWTPLPHHFADVMEAAGWNFHERIIWNKTTSRDGRFGTTIQHPYPSLYYPNQQHEEIQVWRKGDIVTRRDKDSRLEMTELMKKEIANNVWNIPPCPHNKGIRHPCPFPEEIVHRLTLLYSCHGDIVADPMAGSGTTLKVADRLGRTGVGTEIRPAYVAEARQRLAKAPYNRRDQLIAEYQTIIPGEDKSAVNAEPKAPNRPPPSTETGGQMELSGFGDSPGNSTNE